MVSHQPMNQPGSTRQSVSIHFARARDQIPSSYHWLVTALDSFVQSYARYWQAESDLHRASHRFTTASKEQQTRLEDLSRLVSRLVAIAGDEKDGPRIFRNPTQSSPSKRDSRQDSASVQDHARLPALSISCFGRFEVRRAGSPVLICQNRHGQAILRYLVAQPHHRATLDNLIEALWPEDSPDVARHKLHVAISALRRALNGNYEQQKGMGYLRYENGAYQLNQAVTIQVDIDDFMALYRAGEQTTGTEAAQHFEAACRLYTGPFLAEDLYADWSLIRREQLTQFYLNMCNSLAEHYLAEERPEEAAKWARAVLEENRCDEAAYRQLMQAYAHQGRRSDAIRIYQRCERVLAEELGVQPMSDTKALFDAIMHSDSLPSEAHRAQEEACVRAFDAQQARWAAILPSH